MKEGYYWIQHVGVVPSGVSAYYRMTLLMIWNRVKQSQVSGVSDKG